MILDKSKLESKPNWKEEDFNRWADFIELVCLKDGVVSPSDICDLISDGDYDNELQRGEEDHLDKATNLEVKINDYFKVVHYRSEVCGEYYPFSIDSENVVMSVKEISWKQQIYIFLLLCSSISFMSSSVMHIYTTEFEKFCSVIMSRLGPIKAATYLFGTAKGEASPFQGILRDRIKQLAKLLNVEITRRVDRQKDFGKSAGGDYGLDIVSCLRIDDAENIPFGFAQCTCSYDKWIDKQKDIGFDKWRDLLEPLAPYPTYMFVPFSCHSISGTFKHIISLRTTLIDRERIVKLMEMNLDGDYQKLLYGEYQKIDTDSIYG